MFTTYTEMMNKDSTPFILDQRGSAWNVNCSCEEAKQQQQIMKEEKKKKIKKSKRWHNRMEDQSTDPSPWLSHTEDTKTQDRTAQLRTVETATIMNQFSVFNVSKRRK